jgi:hypothetical protein
MMVNTDDLVHETKIHWSHPLNLPTPYRVLLLLENNVARTLEVLPLDQFPAITLIDRDPVE